MNLKEYIKTAITDITSAISELQGELVNGAIVSPSLQNDDDVKSTEYVKDPHDPGCIMKITNIEFDVATTVGTNEGKGAEGGLNISVFQANIGSKSSAKLENVSRIAFTIPVALPAYRVKTDNEMKRQTRIRSTTY